MARKTIKVEIPASEPAAFVRLTHSIVVHHEKPESESPITDKVVKMAKYKEKSDKVVLLQDEIEETEARLKELVGLRDSILGTADGQNSQTQGTLHFETLQIRDLLLAVNRGVENALEPWGFPVVIGEAKSPVRAKKA